MQVVKRNGKREDWNCKKIKKAISFACDGLTVNPLRLEAKFDEFLYDGVTTRSIQDNIILHAKNLASPTDTKWLLVSGRLKTMSRWSDVDCYKKTFLKYFKEQQKIGEWTHEKFDVYDDEDVEIIGKMIVQNRDLQHTIASVETAESKYLQPNECIQTMLMGNAMLYASVESTREKRLAKCLEFYTELSMLDFSLASPQLMNLRKGLNNASCFILAPDDNIDSIFNAIKDASLISKNGGGMGWYLGYIRAKNSSLMGVDGGSSGVLLQVKVLNDTLLYINQGGKRKGAGTVALPCWHNDILDFLDIQTEVGDPRSKSFDIQPQVNFHDLFMQKLLDDKNQIWYTFCPHEVKTKLGITMPEMYNDDFVNAYNAVEKAILNGEIKVFTAHKINDLWKKYLQVFFEKGRPYATFIDLINRQNPNKHDGFILCVNLCVAPETQILTDKGYVTISDYVDQKVNVWNGEEWSEVTVVKTGENQKLLKITVQTKVGDNEWCEKTLSCTEYHKWYDVKGNEIRANDLELNTELLKWCDADGNSIISYVSEINDDERYDDTYCFTEFKRNMGVFNGILTGQCVESFSNTKPDYYHHTCSLASLVVGRIPLEKLSDKASLMTRLLNNGMMITKTPVEESANHLRDYRTIGIGIQGLADILAREGKTYEDLDFITEVCERIQFGAVRESIKMSQEYSPYPKFKGSRWDVGDIFDEYHKNSVCPDLDWLYLKGQCKLYGIYNSQLTSPAPNTSTSIFMMASAGFMPHYAEYFYEDNKDGKTPVASMYLEENPIFYAFSIGYFDQAELTKAVGAGQKFVDTGISSEYVLDRNIHNVTAKDVDNLVKSAWKNQTKAVYYLRTIKVGESLVKKPEDCASCSG